MVEGCGGTDEVARSAAIRSSTYCETWTRISRPRRENAGRFGALRQAWETCIRTEHERVGIQRGEGDEQAAKAAPYVGELWPLSECGKGGVVRAPVDVIGGSWVLEVVI